MHIVYDYVIHPSIDTPSVNTINVMDLSNLYKMSNLKSNDYCLMRCHNNLSDLGYSWCSVELLTEYHDKKYITNEVLIRR